MKVTVRMRKGDSSESAAGRDDNKLSLGKRLKENKIVFDTLLPLIVSIVSLFISIVSLCHGCQVSEDESRLNMPVFNITRQYTKGATIDGLPISSDNVIKYELINQGGDLSSGKANPFQMLTVYAYDGRYSEEISLDYKIFTGFVYPVSYYEPSTNSFTIYRGLHNDVYDILYSIEKRLKADYQNYTFLLSIDDYAEVTYTDYKGNSHIELYDLHNRFQIEEADMLPNGQRYDYLEELYMGNIEDIYERITRDVEEALTRVE